MPSQRCCAYIEASTPRFALHQSGNQLFFLFIDRLGADMGGMTSADLVAAAEGSDWDRVAQCVAAGADVNTRGIDDNTALHLASLQGNEQAVRLRNCLPFRF